MRKVLVLKTYGGDFQLKGPGIIQEGGMLLYFIRNKKKKEDAIVNSLAACSSEKSEAQNEV